MIFDWLIRKDNFSIRFVPSAHPHPLTPSHPHPLTPSPSQVWGQLFIQYFTGAPASHQHGSKTLTEIVFFSFFQLESQQFPLPDYTRSQHSLSVCMTRVSIIG